MNRVVVLAVVLAALSSLAVQAADQTPDQMEQVKLKSAKWMDQRQKADGLFKGGKYAAAESIYKGIIAERQALGLEFRASRFTRCR